MIDPQSAYRQPGQLNLTWTLVPEETVAAVRPALWRRAVLSALVAALWAAVFAYTVLVAVTTILFGLAAIAMFVQVVTPVSWWQWRWRKFSGTTTCSVGDRGIRLDFPRKHVEAKWQTIRAARRNDGSYLVAVHRYRLYMALVAIPARAFVGPTDRAMFEYQLNAHRRWRRLWRL